MENKAKPKIFVDINGNKRYRVEGNLHREDGPAVQYFSGTNMWFIDGLLHRLDGPAIEWIDGDKAWYIKGVKIEVNSQEEFEDYINQFKDTLDIK